MTTSALPAEATPEEARHMSPEEYLRFEAESDVKHEYHAGRVVAMAGATYRHSRIASNTNGECRQRLKGGPCFTLDSDMRVALSAADRYVYPDGLVVCGEPQFAPEDADNELILVNPTVVIEVLSPSTELHDRTDKFYAYLTLRTLREYVLVSQRSAIVEIFYRHDDGLWRFGRWAGVEAVARLESVGIDLPLAEVYAGIRFTPDEEG